MRTVLAILIASLVSPSFAKEDPLRGRMVCAVSASKFVPANENYDASIEFRREVYSPGAILNFDYAYDLEDGIEIFLGEPNGESVLIEEPFPSSSFKGISRTTKSVEYRKTYSEVSLDDFLINYKGNDQLFLRKCGSKESKRPAA